MTEFLQAIIAFPTVLFTVPLGFALLYWGFVIVGAADVDLLGGADGATEGLAEGAAEGLAEGAAEGVAESGGETGLAWVLSVLRLRKAPVTVTMSLFFFWAWMISVFANRAAWNLLGGELPGFAVSTLVFLIAFAGSLVATSTSIRPMESLFQTGRVRGGRALVGRTCTVRSGRVDATFGQAEIEDGGAGILVNVRCPNDNDLKKGREALIIDYEPGRDVYVVEPMQQLLERERPAARVPVAAAEPDAAPASREETRAAEAQQIEAAEEEAETVAEEEPVPVKG